MENKDVEADVEMKESPGPKDGDVSPINRSISNLPETSTLSKSVKKTEPAFELRPNFSRVTPAQVALISFPSDCRYQPVRPLSGHSSTDYKTGMPLSSCAASEKYAGGGGILILVDLRPEEGSEFIEFEPPVEAAPSQPAVPPTGQTTTSTSALHVALDELAPEKEPPASFEVWSSRFFPLDIHLNKLQYPFDNDA